MLRLTLEKRMTNRTSTSSRFGLDRISLKVIGIVFILLSQICCIQPAQPEVCAAFFARESGERISEFQKLDVPTQLQIQLCGLDRHPPADYSFEMANRGPDLIPSLLEELDHQKDDKNFYERDKRAYLVVRAFEALAISGNLAGRKDLLLKLRETVDGIRTEWLRREAENSLQEFQNYMSSETKGN